MSNLRFSVVKPHDGSEASIIEIDIERIDIPALIGKIYSAQSYGGGTGRNLERVRIPLSGVVLIHEEAS